MRARFPGMDGTSERVRKRHCMQTSEQTEDNGMLTHPLARHPVQIRDNWYIEAERKKAEQA